ncbi:MAG: type II toxin-antitoxin system ParD family antitoxin [Candidatus Eisenbacteria bacterium]|nr:type II toxin-antitoxin system ParD family antitoxin [Candidatus Eisenbacteria bacterium]
MADIHANVPEPMREWVESLLSAGEFGNLSEYVRHLIREDRKRRETEQLERLLLEGLDSLDSGRSIEITPEYWEKKRQALIARAEARAKAKATGGS